MSHFPPACRDNWEISLSGFKFSIVPRHGETQLFPSEQFLPQRRAVEEAGASLLHTITPGFLLTTKKVEKHMLGMQLLCIFSMSPFKIQKCFLYLKENTLRKHTSSMNQVFLTVHILDPAGVPQHSCKWCTLANQTFRKWVEGSSDAWMSQWHKLL